MSMSHLFAAILLFSSPGCPHEESGCITPTEYVEINLTFIAEPQPLQGDTGLGSRSARRFFSLVLVKKGRRRIDASPNSPALHLFLSAFARGSIPRATGFLAVGLGLRCRHVSGESGSGHGKGNGQSN